MKFSILLFLSLITFSIADPTYKTFEVNGKSINRWVELMEINEWDAYGRFIHSINHSTGLESWKNYNSNGSVYKRTDGYIEKLDKNDSLLYLKDLHIEYRCISENEKGYCIDEANDTIGFDESFWTYDKWGNKTSYSWYFIDETSERILKAKTQYQYNSDGDTIYSKFNDRECWNEFYQKGLKKQKLCKKGDTITLREEYSETGRLQYSQTLNSVHINRDRDTITIVNGDTTEFHLYDSLGNLIYSKGIGRGGGNWEYFLIDTTDGEENWQKYFVRDRSFYENWYEYDSSGNIVYASNRDGQEEWWKYNDEGNLILHQFAEKESRYIEDVNGPSIIANGLPDSNFEFDNFNNRIDANVKYENGLPRKFTVNDTEYYFTYDEEGNLLSVEDDVGNKQTFSHSKRLSNKRYHVIEQYNSEINGLRNSHNQEIYCNRTKFHNHSWNVYNKKDQLIFSAYAYELYEPSRSLHFTFIDYDKNGKFLYEKGRCYSLTPKKEDCGYWNEYENGKLVFSFSNWFSPSPFSFTQYDKNGKLLYKKEGCNSLTPKKEDCESWEEYENGKLFHRYSKEREIWENWWLKNKKNVAGKIFEYHVDGDKGAMHFNKKGDIEYQKTPSGIEYFFETLYIGKKKKTIVYRAI